MRFSKCGTYFISTRNFILLSYEFIFQPNKFFERIISRIPKVFDPLGKLDIEELYSSYNLPKKEGVLK